MQSIGIRVRAGWALGASLAATFAASPAFADEPNGGAFITDAAARSSGPGHPWQGGPQDVNPYSHNKCTRIPLVEWSSLGQSSIDLSLFHNSYGPLVGSEIGRKWSHSYDASVLTSVDGTRAAVVWGDRTVQLFGKSGQDWLPGDGYRDRLARVGQDFELARKDGTRFVFSQRGLPGARPRHRLFAIVDRSQNRVSLGYDASGRLGRVDDPTGRSLIFAYAQGSLSSIEMRVGLYSRTWRIAHDGDRLSRIAWPEATTDQGPQASNLSFEYDARGNIVRATDQDGRDWSFGYQLDRLAFEQSPGNDANQRARFAILADGTRVLTDGIERLTYFRFDGRSRLARRWDAGGNATTYEYADADYGFAPSRTVSPTGDSTGADYDARGNAVGLVDAAGNRWDFAYDGYDRLVRRLEPLITDAWGVRQSDRNRTDYRYDQNGNLIQVQRFKPSGSEDTVYEYDGLGQLVREIDPLGNATTYAYDAYGNRTMSRSPEGRVAVQLFETEILSMGFTSANAVIDGLGRRTELLYDERGRLVGRRYASDPPERYVYDAMDRLVRAENGFGTSTFSYNPNGWLEQETGRGGWVRTTYYPNGRIASEQAVTPNTNVVTDYGYDYRNLVDRLTQGGSTTLFTYDAAGRLVRRLLPNGASAQFGYARGRLASVVHVDRLGMPVSAYVYEYQEDGRLAKVTEFDGAVTKYGYDALGRLVREERNGSYPYRFDWAYDAAGNRVLQVRNGLPTTYQVDRDGLVLMATSQQDGPTAYLYDAAGRLIQRDSSRASYQFQYDDAGRLARGLLLGNQGFALAFEYQYDALGRRLRRTAWRPDGSLDRQTESLLAGVLPVVEESNGTAGPSSLVYLWHDGLIAARDGGGAWASWSAEDGLGSLRAGTDAQGLAEAWRTGYNAFGVEVHRDAGPRTCFGFRAGFGVRTDGDAGLLAGAGGFYDPAIGGWICKTSPGVDNDCDGALDDIGLSTDTLVDSVHGDLVGLGRLVGATVAQDPPRPKEPDPLDDWEYFRPRPLPEPPPYRPKRVSAGPPDPNPFDPKRQRALATKLPSAGKRKLSVAAGWKQR